MPISLGTTTITAIYLGTTSIVSAYLGSTQVFGGASAFTPLSLFSGGAQGVWYDPSDLTTMFVDRAGTTPVTAPGQLVGLRLDKSKGLTPGAELVTNGDFASGITSWVSQNNSNTAISWDAGELKAVTSNTNGGLAYQNISTVAGRSYKVTADVRTTAGNLFGYIWSQGIATLLQTATVVAPTSTRAVTFVFTAVGTTTVVSFVSAQATTWYLDNISVRELPGNHATAPTDAARPMYGVEPKGGRRNLLTWSEDFGNAVWLKAGVSVSGNVATATSGGAAVYRSFTIAPDATHTFSVKLKAGSATFAAIRALDFTTSGGAWFDLSSGAVGTVNAGLTASISPIDADGYYRCEVRFSATPDVSGDIYIYLTDANASYGVTVGRTIQAKEAQFELGSTATPYQRVTIAENVTEAGVPTCHYCRYDGANNSMSTSAIDFSGTDKMSVFAGVTKLGTTAYPVLAELGIGGSSGGFVWHANGAGSSTVFLGNYTSPTAAAFFSDGGANQTYVGSVLLNRGGTSGALSEIAFRKNTVAISGAQDGSLSDSTGNYGNLAWFIGRRNNASLPFNGRDYGIIIVGKLASAGEITDTETWLAAKTAQVTL